MYGAIEDGAYVDLDTPNNATKNDINPYDVCD